MSPSKDETPKKRGRPRKVLKEELRIASQPIDNEKNKIDTLFSGEDGNLLRNQEFQNEMKDFASSLPRFELNESAENISLGLKEQVQHINKQLDILDVKYKEGEVVVQSITKIKNFLELQQVTIRDLIRNEQDCILHYEEKIDELPGEHFTVDRNSLTRWILDKIFGKKDEICLREGIARSETIISQLESKLVPVTEALSKALLAFEGNQRILELLESVRENYREVRLELGKDPRLFEAAAKNQKTKDLQNSIIANYLAKGEKLKELGTDISASLMVSGRSISQKVQELQIDAAKNSFLPKRLPSLRSMEQVKEDEKNEKNEKNT